MLWRFMDDGFPGIRCYVVPTRCDRALEKPSLLDHPNARISAGMELDRAGQHGVGLVNRKLDSLTVGLLYHPLVNNEKP